MVDLPPELLPSGVARRPRKVTSRHLDYIYDRLLEQQTPDVIAHRTSDPDLKLSTSWNYQLLEREVAKGDD